MFVSSQVSFFFLFYIKVYRHSKNSIKTGYDTFKHDHDPHKRKRDYKRLFQQKKVHRISNVLPYNMHIHTISVIQFFLNFLHCQKTDAHTNTLISVACTKHLISFSFCLFCVLYLFCILCEISSKALFALLEHINHILFEYTKYT